MPCVYKFLDAGVYIEVHSDYDCMPVYVYACVLVNIFSCRQLRRNAGNGVSRVGVFICVFGSTAEALCKMSAI